MKNLWTLDCWSDKIFKGFIQADSLNFAFDSIKIHFFKKEKKAKKNSWWFEMQFQSDFYRHISGGHSGCSYQSGQTATDKLSAGSLGRGASVQTKLCHQCMS